MVREYVGLCTKLTPLLKGGQEKYLIQSCISFDQHCRMNLFLPFPVYPHFTLALLL